MDRENDDRGGYFSNARLFQAIEALRVDVGDVKTDVRVLQQKVDEGQRSAERDQTDEDIRYQRLELRVAKIEARINSALVAVGIGAATGLVYIWRQGAV